MSTLLDRLIRISTRTAIDSGKLIDDSRDHDLSELYVERDIESELLRTLRSSTSVKVLSGEAGTGKTSLLWNLYRRLRPELGRTVLFLRADIVATIAAETPLAGQLVQQRSPAPIMLVDTADSILVAAHTRNAFLEALDTFAEAGFSVLVTCRTIESSRYLTQYKPESLPEEYSEREFVQVLQTHAEYFYVDSRGDSLDARVADLKNAIAQERPVGMLAKRPLLLRMLFALYAPHEVPVNINAGQLYADFWRRRVVLDWRAGQPGPEPSSVDLSVAASCLAYQMLQRGVLLLSKAEADAVLAAGNCSAQSLRELASRGIVKFATGDVRSEFVEFFHQTFFEHTAARALLLRHPTSAAMLLADHLRASADDHLRYPVFEQLLLISQAAPFSVQQPAEIVMTKILEVGPAELSRPALRAFAQMEAPTERLRQAALAAMTERREVIAFIGAVSSAPMSRREEIWSTLKQLWSVEKLSLSDRDRWSYRIAILKEVPRLARSGAELSADIAAFLEREETYNILARDAVYIGVRAFEALIEKQHSSFLLLRLLERLQRENAGPKVESLPLLALARCAPDRGRLLDMSLQRLGNSELEDRVVGFVYASEWLDQVASTEVLHSHPRDSLPRHLSAIAAWLSQQPDSSWQEAWTQFEAVSEEALRQMWVKLVWDRLCMLPLDKNDIPHIRLVRFIAPLVSSRLIDAGANRAGALGVCRHSRSFALRTELLKTVLESYEPIQGDFESPERLGYLLGPAVAMRYGGALAALSRPSEFVKSLKARLFGDIENVLAAAPNVLDHLVPVLVLNRQFHLIERPIEMGIVNLGSFSERISSALAEQVRILLISDSINERQRGARWTFFAGSQLIGAVQFDFVRGLMERETDSSVASWLSRAMCVLAITDEDICSAIGWMKTTIANDTYSRDKVFESWMKFVVRHKRIEEIKVALEVAQLAECNLKRVRDIARALPRVSEIDRSVAATLAVSLLTFRWFEGKKTVIGSFVLETLRPFTEWSSQADWDHLRTVLAKVPLVDSEIGRMIVKFAYVPPHKTAVAPLLRQLLNSQNISHDVKLAVASVLRARSQDEGVTQWNISESLGRLEQSMPTQGISNAFAGRDIYQLQIFGGSYMNNQREVTGQQVESTLVGGSVLQSSDSAADAQIVRNARVQGDIEQSRASKSLLWLPQMRATGTSAIVVLLVVVVAILLYRHFGS